MDKKVKPIEKAVTHEEFVRAWQCANDAKEVAQALGITISGVYSRANSLKRSGVHLKRIGTLRFLDRPNVPALNELIGDLEKGDA